MERRFEVGVADPFCRVMYLVLSIVRKISVGGLPAIC